MTIYECPRCFYKTSVKTNIKFHYNKAIKCKVVLNGYNVDIDRCIELINEPVNILDIAKLEYIINKINNENLIIINDNYYCNVIKTNVNSYDKPEISHIGKEFCDKLLNNYNYVDIFIKMAEKIWFDIDHPENHSLFKTTKPSTNNEIKYVEDGIVKLGNISDIELSVKNIVLSTLERGENESIKYYDFCDIIELPVKASQEQIKVYNELWYKIRKNIGYLLYNNKSRIKLKQII